MKLLALPLLAILALLSSARSQEWSTDMALWSAAVDSGPEMPRAHLCLGLAHKDAGEWAEAATEFGNCRDLAMAARDGIAGRCVNNIGSVAFALGDLERAEGQYLLALQIDPGMVDAMVAQISNEVDFDPYCIATGGLAKMIAGESKTIQETDSLLTLRGLKILFERNR